jgi:HSP20 family protein
MTIVRWEPFRDLVGLQNRMNRLFAQSQRGEARAGEEESPASGSWVPAVDIFEKDGNIVLTAELPGIDIKDVDVRVLNNVLTLQGQRKFDQELQKDNVHRVERVYGSFTRSFTLPSVVDTEKIKAESKDGVLKVTLPKREEAKAKQIQVQAA